MHVPYAPLLGLVLVRGKMFEQDGKAGKIEDSASHWTECDRIGMSKPLVVMNC